MTPHCREMVSHLVEIDLSFQGNVISVFQGKDLSRQGNVLSVFQENDLSFQENDLSNPGNEVVS